MDRDEGNELISEALRELTQREKEDWERFSPLWLIEKVYPNAHSDRRFLKSLYKETRRFLTLLRQRKFKELRYTPALREKLMRELGIFLPPKRGRPHGALWDVRMASLTLSSIEEKIELYAKHSFTLPEDLARLIQELKKEEEELFEEVRKKVKSKGTKGIRSVALKYLKGKSWLYGYPVKQYPTPLDWVLSNPKHRGVVRFIVFYALSDKREELFERWREWWSEVRNTVSEEVMKKGYLKKGIRETARQVLLYVLDRKVEKPKAFLEELKAQLEYLLSSKKESPPPP